MNSTQNRLRTVISNGMNANDTINQGDESDSTEESDQTGEALDAADDAMQQWMSDPNDPETQDRLTDEFQDLLQWQSDQIAAAESAKDTSAAQALTACATYLKQSQAAAKKKDTADAKRLLAEYQACIQKVKLPTQSNAKPTKAGSGGTKPMQK